MEASKRDVVFYTTELCVPYEEVKKEIQTKDELLNKAIANYASELTKEGIEIWVPVEYTLESLLSQFDSALRSAMSYTGCRTLQEFKNVEWEYMSPSERNAYYK